MAALTNQTTKVKDMTQQTPKEKAQELIEKFKDYVHGYIGSSMLTNHEYPEQILSQAKKVSLIAIDEICEAINWHEFESPNEQWDYWNEVKIEVDNL